MIIYSSIVQGLGARDRARSMKTVCKKEYRIFQKEYVFDQLKDMSYGQSFCNRFDVHDPLLCNLSNDLAKFHIEHLGYIQ